MFETKHELSYRNKDNIIGGEGGKDPFYPN